MGGGHGVGVGFDVGWFYWMVLTLEWIGEMVYCYLISRSAGEVLDLY